MEYLEKPLQRGDKVTVEFTDTVAAVSPSDSDVVKLSDGRWYRIPADHITNIVHTGDPHDDVIGTLRLFTCDDGSLVVYSKTAYNRWVNVDSDGWRTDESMTNSSRVIGKTLSTPDTVTEAASPVIHSSSTNPIGTVRRSPLTRVVVVKSAAEENEWVRLDRVDSLYTNSRILCGHSSATVAPWPVIGTVPATPAHADVDPMMSAHTLHVLGKAADNPVGTVRRHGTRNTAVVKTSASHYEWMSLSDTHTKRGNTPMRELNGWTSDGAEQWTIIGVVPESPADEVLKNNTPSPTF